MNLWRLGRFGDRYCYWMPMFIFACFHEKYSTNITHSI